VIRAVNLTRRTFFSGFFCCRLSGIGVEASLHLGVLPSRRQFRLTNGKGRVKQEKSRCSEGEAGRWAKRSQASGSDRSSDKGLPSGRAGPGSEAAAMWPHMAAVPLAALRLAEQAELVGRQAFEQARARERPGRSARPCAAVEPERIAPNIGEQYCSP
jgi:hypothetical protein